jgi:hypothetical protein
VGWGYGGVNCDARVAIACVVVVFGLGVGEEGAGRDGGGGGGDGGHESTQSALWCRESLPFSTWSFVLNVQGNRGNRVGSKSDVRW